jgi:hypothetical protein
VCCDKGRIRGDNERDSQSQFRRFRYVDVNNVSISGEN